MAYPLWILNGVVRGPGVLRRRVDRPIARPAPPGGRDAPLAVVRTAAP
jgi:hypothetical protein